jgi:hypothetical protein
MDGRCQQRSFGGRMSIYLVAMIFWKGRQSDARRNSPGAGGAADDISRDTQHR